MMPFFKHGQILGDSCQGGALWALVGYTWRIVLFKFPSVHIVVKKKTIGSLWERTIHLFPLGSLKRVLS